MRVGKLADAIKTGVILTCTDGKKEARLESGRHFNKELPWWRQSLAELQGNIRPSRSRSRPPRAFILNRVVLAPASYLCKYALVCPVPSSSRMIHLPAFQVNIC